MNRLTIRLRLTALYGLLFLLGGALLLGVTYLLLAQRLGSGTGAQVFTGQIGPGVAARDQLYTMARQQLDATRQDALNSLLTQGGLALLGVTVIAVGFGWLLSERALRPVHKITETARRVAAGNLHERIALDGPRDEVKELADTFDRMLDRLDGAFDGQRRFVANASHELRTPLSVIRTEVDVTLGDPRVQR